MSDSKKKKLQKVIYAFITLVIVCVITGFYIYTERRNVTKRMSDEAALEYLLSLDEEKLYKYMDSVDEDEYMRLLKLHTAYCIEKESVNDSFAQ